MKDITLCGTNNVTYGLLIIFSFLSLLCLIWIAYWSSINLWHKCGICGINVETVGGNCHITENGEYICRLCLRDIDLEQRRKVLVKGLNREQKGGAE